MKQDNDNYIQMVMVKVVNDVLITDPCHVLHQFLPKVNVDSNWPLFCRPKACFQQST